jgi:peptide deformylase
MSENIIIRAGHQTLLDTAEAIADPTAPEVAELIRTMIEQMSEAGGVGLAAPQIAVSQRAIIFWVPDRRLTEFEDDHEMPLTALINPEFEPLSDATNDDWEGCLSIPGLRGMVPRYSHIRYRGYDLAGKPVERLAGGFHARVVQHEIDHLNGVLYPMRIADMATFGFDEEIRDRLADEKARAHG